MGKETAKYRINEFMAREKLMTGMCCTEDEDDGKEEEEEDEEAEKHREISVEWTASLRNSPKSVTVFEITPRRR